MGIFPNEKLTNQCLVAQNKLISQEEKEEFKSTVESLEEINLKQTPILTKSKSTMVGVQKNQ